MKLRSNFPPSARYTEVAGSLQAQQGLRSAARESRWGRQKSLNIPQVYLSFFISQRNTGLARTRGPEALPGNPAIKVAIIHASLANLCYK